MKVALSSNSADEVELPEDILTFSKSFESDMMDSRELLYLAATLWNCKWRDGWILVEIGAFHGQTTVFMAQVLSLLGQKPPILSIDPFEHAVPDSLNPSGCYSAYIANVTSYCCDRQCMPLVAFSHDAAPVVPSNVGVLVLDGSHHYPAVSGDLRLFAPKVQSGGYIFIDDYGGAYPDVMRAVDEFFAQNASFEVIHREYFVIARRVTDGEKRW